MQAAELEPDFEPDPPSGHARRALSLITVSMVAIVVTGVVYVRPTLSASGEADTSASPPPAEYRVSAVDFVDPRTGWVVADFDSGDYGVLHTADAGRTWTRQLSGAGGSHARYLKFFDAAVGVFALIGVPATIHKTADGGRTWSSIVAQGASGNVVSWSFVDSDHAWILVAGTAAGERDQTKLYRTEDGGFTWTDLGSPVMPGDRAFQVQFSFLTTGWLTAASGPYAYRTQDFGDTWSRIALPAPRGGWPSGGQFLVAPLPTREGGVLASVAYFPAIKGRSGIGGEIRGFPPLVVRGFDGGRAHTYSYATLIDQVAVGPHAANEEQAPTQWRLSTVDGVTWRFIEPPSAQGAIGFFDAAHWWWIDAGTWAASGDGGATWTAPHAITSIDPVPGSLRVLDVQHAWFVSATGTGPALETTDDGAAHWRAVVLPPQPDAPATP